MKNRESLEILKQSQEAYKLANEKFLTYNGDYKRDFMAIEKKYDEEINALKLDLNASIKELKEAYKNKVKDVRARKQKETSPFKKRQRAISQLETNSYHKGSAYSHELRNFREKHDISDQQMVQLLEQETGKKWKVERVAHSGVWGYDGQL